MPANPSRLPARPSLEHLRKQAKDLLKQAAAGDDAALARFGAIMPVPAAPTLADAQFVLAREYGFDTWTALAHHVETVNPAGLRRFERLAEEVAGAYTSADVERLREINWTYGTSFVWYREPERMHAQLPAWSAGERTHARALADARQLVARMAGFEDWTALAASVTRTAPAVHSSEQASFYRIQHDTIGVRGPLADQHWDTIAAVIAERQLAGVRAGGATDAAIERLSRLPHLTKLYVGGGQITDAGVRHLARLPALEELALGGPRSLLTDRGLAVLRQLPLVRRFWITWAPHVTDAGLAHLAGCERLEVVDLMGTPSGDGALAALAGKPDLRKLATGRLVTDAGVALLTRFPRFLRWGGGTTQCDVGAFDSEPTHLLLDGPFTPAGLAEAPRLDGLFGMNIFWHATGVTDRTFAALAAMPRLGFLRVDRDDATTDEGLRALSGSSRLESLACADSPHVTGTGFGALASLPALHSLSLDCRRVDDEALARLPQFPALRTFWPRGLRDDGFRYVGRCTALESIALTREATDAATAHVAVLPNLTSFSAGAARITDRSLALLARMPSLERIDIHACPGVTDAGVALLASLPNLSELLVWDCPRLTAAGLSALPATVRVRRAAD